MTDDMLWLSLAGLALAAVSFAAGWCVGICTYEPPRSYDPKRKAFYDAVYRREDRDRDAEDPK